MRKLFLLLSSVLILAGCAEQYNIAGSSSVPCLDGRMLYLRVLPSEGVTTTYAATRCIDSCMIMHGRFNFEGDMDSAMMAMAMMQGMTCAIVNPCDSRMMETIRSCDVILNRVVYSDSYLEL